MATGIKMPDLGTTVEAVTLVSWLKNVGDTVARGEPLCEVETDKAVSELESVAEGVLLRQDVEPETEIEVGQIIAYIGKPGEVIRETSAKRSTSSTDTDTDEATKPTNVVSKQDVSPLIRNLAERLGVDLEHVDGTGPGGRVTREDVQRANDETGTA